MNRMFAILVKELRSYFNSPIAYIFMLTFLMGTAAFFFLLGTTDPYGRLQGNFYIRGEASLTAYFRLFPIALAVLVPILCMRLWPEERKSGTMEVLMTLPIRSWEVVLGKFLAMVTILVMTFALSATVPYCVSLFAVGEIDYGPVIGGYVGAILMGAAYCAIGLLSSSFTREQVVAVLLALVVALFLGCVGSPRFEIFIPGWLSPITSFIGFTPRFASIEKGVLDIRDMFYFGSFTVLFVFLNVTVIEYRRLR